MYEIDELKTRAFNKSVMCDAVRYTIGRIEENVRGYEDMARRENATEYTLAMRDAYRAILSALYDFI